MSRRILEKVISLLKRGWTYSGPARNIEGRRVDANAIEACAWSLFGALAAASRPTSEEWHGAVKIIMAATGLPKEVDLFDWSESRARRQGEVVAVVEKALKVCA